MVEAPEKIWAWRLADRPGCGEWQAKACVTEPEYVRSDIAERQIAELRAQSDRFCDKYLAALKRAEAAEAENARLKALPLKDEVEGAIVKIEEIRRQLQINVEIAERDHPEGPIIDGKRVKGMLHSQDILAGHIRDRLNELESLLSRLRAGVQEGWRPDILYKLAEHTNLELSWGAHPDDDTEACWQVHRVNGGRNDREWTLVGVGNTPREALYAALPASPSVSEGGSRNG